MPHLERRLCPACARQHRAQELVSWSLFEDLGEASDPMLEAAQAVARNLDGDVLDETRSALTRQTLEHSRQQIRDLERRLLARSR